MKNIHVLPTDKPSRLVLDANNTLVLAWNKSIEENAKYKKNIYITNDEEIKEGEYGLSKLNEIIKFHSGYDYRYYAKIILTTDPSLAPDVQAIDDEFLEWFVKNPSCEQVEVERVVVYDDNNYGSGEIFHSNRKFEYKIIIPKEEPKVQLTQSEFKNAFFGKEEQKQHLIDMMKSDEELGLYDEPKQETLEEFKKRFANDKSNKDIKLDYQDGIYYGIEVGAKWQQEQIGKSEFLQKLRGTLSDAEARRLIFEQFKKK